MRDPNTPDLFPDFGTHPVELVRTEDPDTSHEGRRRLTLLGLSGWFMK
jgi:hypothetical protein